MGHSKFSSVPSRRCVVGLVVIVLGTLDLQTCLIGDVQQPAEKKSEIPPAGHGVYIGSVRELLVPSQVLGENWSIGTDLLIEDPDRPPRIKGEDKDAELARVVLNTTVAFLKRIGARAAGNFTYDRKSKDLAETCDVKIIVFKDVPCCKTAWDQRFSKTGDAYLKDSTLGEDAFVSKGTLSLEGKVFLRRANVWTSIVPLGNTAACKKLAGELDAKLKKTLMEMDKNGIPRRGESA